MILRWRDLDHIIPTNSVRSAIFRIAPRRSEGCIPPGSGVPVPGANPGSSTSMSTDSEFRAVQRLVDCLIDHRLDAPIEELTHQVPAHALSPHPLEGLGLRPVAAQPDLDEVATRDRTRLD